MIVEFVIQVLLVSVLLTLIGGVSQLLPIGIGSAQQLRQQSGAETQPFGTTRERVLDVTATPVAAEHFDRVTVNRVSTLTTDGSFSWIVSRPLSSYRPARYLALEFVTQVLVACGIVALHALLGDAEPGTKIVAAVLAAALTAVAAYGQLVNWWGLTLRYFSGVVLTLVAGWALSMWLVTLLWP